MVSIRIYITKHQFLACFSAIGGLLAFNPIISPFWDVTLIAVALSAISFVLQRKFVDRKKMKEIQARMKERQKKIKELMKREDQQSKNDVMKMQNEMMQESMGMMKGSMKQMLAMFIIIIPIFWYLGVAYEKSVFPLPFEVPFIGDKASWIILYIVASLITSAILNFGAKILEKKPEGFVVNQNVLNEKPEVKQDVQQSTER